MIKALIFDMDGVLVDTEPYHEAFLTKVLKGLGIDVTGNLFGELRGTDAKTFWSTVSKRYGLPEQTEGFIEETRQKYLEFLQVQYTLRPVDGVPEALKILKKKSIPMAVATSASKARASALLDILKIKKYFDAMICAQDVQKGKPAPDIFLTSALKINAHPNESAVIEDSTNGVEAAKAAGMKCIGFAGLPHNKQDLSGADRIITHFDEITTFMKTGGNLSEFFAEVI